MPSMEDWVTDPVPHNVFTSKKMAFMKYLVIVTEKKMLMMSSEHTLDKFHIQFSFYIYEIRKKMLMMSSEHTLDKFHIHDQFFYL